LLVVAWLFPTSSATLRSLPLQAYLSRDEFKRVFGVSKPELYAMPKWKRTDLRKRVGLF
jgi:hypothetical protein